MLNLKKKKNRRNLESIKLGNFAQRNNLLMNELKQTPGLQVGIIGMCELKIII